MKTLFFLVIIFLFIISFLYESYPLKYYDIVRKKSELFDPLLVISVMYVESNFKEDAVSPKGAIGLMQIMPATADWISKKYKIDGDTASSLKLLSTYITLMISKGSNNSLFFLTIS